MTNPHWRVHDFPASVNFSANVLKSLREIKLVLLKKKQNKHTLCAQLSLSGLFSQECVFVKELSVGTMQVKAFIL